MAKETHSIWVWALRGGRRHLELSLDSPSASKEARALVEQLKSDATVDGIEVKEYLVLTEDADGRLPAHRGTMRWARAAHGWKRLRDLHH